MQKISLSYVRVLVVTVMAAVMVVSVSCKDNIPVDCCTGDDNGGENDGPIFLGNPPVIINEINSLNIGYTDEFGETPGWVEFYNPADTAVNLNGYVLTSSLNRRQWTFGDVTLEPHGYLIVFLSGRNMPDFETQSYEFDMLYNSVGAWDWSDSRVEPPEPPGGSTTEHTYTNGLQISGKITAVNNNGPGELGWTSALVMLRLMDRSITVPSGANNWGWGDNVTVDLSRARQIRFRGYISDGSRMEVRIAQTGMNEWETWLAGVLIGTGIENDLYTVDVPVTQPVFPNMKQVYGLRFANQQNWFGTIEFNFNSIIAPMQANDLHASFQLSAGGGSFYLMDPDDYIRDSLAYPAGVRGLSYARTNSGGWKYGDAPTPGAANDGNFFDGQLPTVSANGIPESGYHGENITFTIPAGTGGSVIYCDTTGRMPTENNVIRSGVQLTASRPFVMRCAQFKDGSYRSEPIMRTYILGRQPSLPIVSIAVDPKDMFDPVTGLYSLGPNAETQEPYYGANFWEETELPIHIDFFEGGVNHAWSHPAGLRIFGGWSRAISKKSVLISFRAEYGGPNRLNYPLLPQYPQLTRFKHILLRNNGNNAGLDYIRDMLMTSLTEGLGIDYQKGRPVIVFYNGEYFGIHNLRERSNSDYFETNYGINEDFVDLVKANGEVSQGSDADYQNIISWLNGISGLSDENLSELNRRIDVDNYTNYIQSQIFYLNKDWPGNNLKRWRTNAPPSRWKWFLYDTDHGFGSFGSSHSPNVPMLNFVTSATGTSSGTDSWVPNPPHSTFLTRKLLENQNYKNAFVNRFSLLIATYFATTRVNAKIDELMRPIENEIPLDVQRWRSPAPFNDWRWNPSVQQSEFDKIKNFAATRPAQMQREIETFFDIGGAVNFTLSADGGGKIFVHNLEVPNGSAVFKAYASIPIVLRAEPIDGRVFLGWSDGETAAERVITVDEAMTLKAEFGTAL